MVLISLLVRILVLGFALQQLHLRTSVGLSQHLISNLAHFRFISLSLRV